MNYITSVELEPSVNGDERMRITIEYRPGPLGRLCGFKPKTWTEEYVGSCTVWHRLPGFERVGTAGETRLVELWEKARYERAMKRRAAK